VISHPRVLSDTSKMPSLDPLYHLRFFNCASIPRPRKGYLIILFLISKDSSFDAINALQISFNYLYPFKNYLGVPTFLEHSVYDFI